MGWSLKNRIDQCIGVANMINTSRFASLIVGVFKCMPRELAPKSLTIMLASIFLLASCTKREISSVQSEQFLKYFGTIGTDIPGDILLAGEGYAMLGNEWGTSGQIAIVYVVDKNGNIEQKHLINDTLNVTATAMIQSPDGYYVCGNSVDPFGYSDIYVAKLDDSFAVQWEKTFGGSYDETANCLTLNDAGQVLLAGAISKSVERDPEALDLLLMQLSATGDSLSSSTIGADDTDIAYGITTNNQGHIIVVGETSSFNDAGQEKSNILVVTFNPNGYLLNRATYGGEGHDCAYSVCNAGNGQFYVAGVAENNDGDADMWVACFNESIHAPVWEHTEGEARDDYCFSISAYEGKLLLGGYTIDLATKNKDVFVVEYSESGEKQNQYVSGGKGDEVVHRAIFSHDGKPVFVGSSDFESNTVLFIQKITF